MRGENTELKNTFVVDASFVLAYLLPDEGNRGVEEIFSKFEQNKVHFVSPDLLVHEIINALRSAVIQKRQSVEGAKRLLDGFLNLGIHFEKIDEGGVLSLALSRSITAYDASYVWLANNRKAKLLTLDERLENIAK